MRPARKGETAGATKRGRILGGALSFTAHLLILLAMLWNWSEQPRLIEPEAVTVELIGPPAPAPKPASPAPAAAPAPSPPAKPPPRRRRATPSPPEADYLPAQVTHKSDTGSTLTEAQLAGAATAGSGGEEGGGGGGGGRCDMAGRLQAALRKDPMVRAAIAGAGAKAALVWNGDWVQSLGEDGKGLATIREAILWEVAFAPAACRSQAMRGLVVLSLSSATGPTRLALGSGSWRWSDLLASHPGGGTQAEQ